MTDLRKLPPCPFCGGTDIKEYPSGDGEVFIQCADCSACGPDHKNGMHWNTRIDAALAKPVEPVAWIQSNHLHNAKNAPFLCRVEPNEREGFIPLYAAPADQWRRVEDGLPPNWKIKVTGPDSDGLLWLTISNTSGRHLSFSAASGDGLLRGAILTELMRDLSALLEGE